MNNMSKKRVMSLLGLATRARKVVSGDDTTLQDLKKGKVDLVIVATDASDNTKKLFRDKSSFRNIKMVEYGTKEEIGNAIGKSFRAVIGIEDKGFAKKILELLEEI